MTIEPQAFIQVRFKTTDEGGRKGPLLGPYYGCPMRVDDEYFECRLVFEGRTLELGTTYTVPVLFLSPELVLPKLAIGKRVTLWEGKDVADGEVVQLPRLLKQ